MWWSRQWARLWIAGILAAVPPLSLPAQARIWVVAESGGDFSSIQSALDAAQPGDTVRVREKAAPYFERLVFPRSGSATAGPIVLRAAAGEHPVLDGSGVPGEDMIRIPSRSYVQVIGLEIRNNLGVHDGSGIRVIGSGSDIEIRDNRIHELRGRNAMGITVYGTDPAQPIQRLVIDGNEIWDAEPHPSEALVLNGNVQDFQVTGNHVHDVNNIGIDMIGGETDINPDPNQVARKGLCAGNRVERANEKRGGFAGGIYVDGGRDILVERNVVVESDLGIEVGAENPGIVTSGVVVRSNLLVHNERAGLVFGGFQASVGRVRNCVFRHNTLYENDTFGSGFGEVWIQYAENNRVEHNLVVSTAQGVLLHSEAGNVGNTLDWNLWFAPDGPATARFSWNGPEVLGLSAYRAATGQGGNSLLADPLLMDPSAGDFRLSPASPALDAGSPAFVPDPGELDLGGEPRSTGPRVDLGADEINQDCGDGRLDPGEGCDDGNRVSGDGCDANCTPTGCGNGIQTAGEACDDGNLQPGDCCDGSCQREPDGSPCEDGDLCTRPDTCAAGRCRAATAPVPLCLPVASSGHSSFELRDRSPDRRDRVIWRYRAGAATSVADFGNPPVDTSYALCVWDGSGGAAQLVFRASIPAGGQCNGRPCWKDRGSHGFRYKDRGRTPEGIDTLVLRPGAVGKTALTVKGRGERLRLPTLPLQESPQVVVQLVNDAGSCWQTLHSAPARKATADRWKDRD